MESNKVQNLTTPSKIAILITKSILQYQKSQTIKFATNKNLQLVIAED